MLFSWPENDTGLSYMIADKVIIKNIIGDNKDRLPVNLITRPITENLFTTNYRNIFKNIIPGDDSSTALRCFNTDVDELLRVRENITISRYITKE